ncbi:MAG: hypothetical protein JWQ09_2997 [Segetibacter sp.]|nr:hypothetical protein [Segetibacter sp.]
MLHSKGPTGRRGCTSLQGRKALRKSFTDDRDVCFVFLVFIRKLAKTCIMSEYGYTFYEVDYKVIGGSGDSQLKKFYYRTTGTRNDDEIIHHIKEKDFNNEDVKVEIVNISAIDEEQFNASLGLFI